jgi:ACS family tartrate transporter-like MFS transporter
MPNEVDPVILRKVWLRLIPFLFVLYIVAYLDRVNVGFAALQMNSDLKFSSATFGLASGIFFLGYCLFEVPSNLILARVGARLWIARIMVTWGLIASAMMFVHTPASFYILRFILGIAEAGFFPGVIFFLSRWFPESARARTIAAFMTGIPFSGIIGGPLSGALLSLNGCLGLAGWQWLFLVEGLLAVVLGVVVLGYLTDRPEQAKWLERGQREALALALDREQRHGTTHHRQNVRQAILNPQVWGLGVVLFLANSGFYGYLIWSPQIIRSISATGNGGVGLISGAISILMAIAMVSIGAHSDRGGERRLHAAVPLLLMGIGFIACVLAPSPLLSLVGLAMIPIGIGAAYGPLWALPGSFLAGNAAAAGIALVASIGNSGGFLGPTLIGLLKSRTGGYQSSFVMLGIMAIAAAVVTLWLVKAPAKCKELVGVRPNGSEQ